MTPVTNKGSRGGDMEVRDVVAVAAAAQCDRDRWGGGDGHKG